MDRPVKVLITGASGFVGLQLVSKLRMILPGGSVITAVDKSQRIPSVTPSNNVAVLYRSMDLLRESEIQGLVEEARPDVVCHLAAIATTGDLVNAGLDLWDVNVTGTLHLARAVQRIVPEACFIFASSSEVYGRVFATGEALDETAALAPMNHYARSKLAAEFALSSVFSAPSRLVILRLFNHTGAGQDARFALPAFASQIAKIEAGLMDARIRVGNLSAKRDFLDIRDVIRAYVKVIENAFNLGSFSTYNICSGNSYLMSDILRSFIEKSTKEIIIEEDPLRMRASEIRAVTGNAALFVEKFDWSPEISLDTTVSDILDYWRQEIIF